MTVLIQHIVLMALALTAQPPVNPHAKVLDDFNKRIEQYVEVRKKADTAATPDLHETKDPAKIRMAQQGLAERIRTVRSGARHGDIFTPEISAEFRRLMRPESKEKGTKALIQDDNPGKFPFNINGPYPENEPLSTVPPNILQSLPKLPKDVEYRFIAKHLILRDTRANLIIDYIPNVIS